MLQQVIKGRSNGPAAVAVGRIDGRVYFVIGCGNWVVVLDAEFEVLQRLGLGVCVHAVAWGAEHSTIAVSVPGKILIYDIARREHGNVELHMLISFAMDHAVSCLAWHPSERTLLAGGAYLTAWKCGSDGWTRRWRQITTVEPSTLCFCRSNGGQSFLSLAGHDRNVKIWTRRQFDWIPKDKMYFSFAYLPHESTVVSAHWVEIPRTLLRAAELEIVVTTTVRGTSRVWIQRDSSWTPLIVPGEPSKNPVNPVAASELARAFMGSPMPQESRRRLWSIAGLKGDAPSSSYAAVAAADERNGSESGRELLDFVEANPFTFCRIDASGHLQFWALRDPDKETASVAALFEVRHAMSPQEARASVTAPALVFSVAAGNERVADEGSLRLCCVQPRTGIVRQLALDDLGMCIGGRSYGAVVKQRAGLTGHKRAIVAIKSHPNKNCLISVDESGELVLWKLQNQSFMPRGSEAIVPLDFCQLQNCGGGSFAIEGELMLEWISDKTDLQFMVGLGTELWRFAVAQNRMQRVAQPNLCTGIAAPLKFFAYFERHVLAVDVHNRLAVWADEGTRLVSVQQVVPPDHGLPVAFCKPSAFALKFGEDAPKSEFALASFTGARITLWRLDERCDPALQVHMEIVAGVGARREPGDEAVAFGSGEAGTKDDTDEPKRSKAAEIRDEAVAREVPTAAHLKPAADAPTSPQARQIGKVKASLYGNLGISFASDRQLLQIVGLESGEAVLKRMDFPVKEFLWGYTMDGQDYLVIIGETQQILVLAQERNDHGAFSGRFGWSVIFEFYARSALFGDLKLFRWLNDGTIIAALHNKIVCFSKWVDDEQRNKILAPTSFAVFDDSLRPIPEYHPSTLTQLLELGRLDTAAAILHHLLESILAFEELCVERVPWVSPLGFDRLFAAPLAGQSGAKAAPPHGRDTDADNDLFSFGARVDDDEDDIDNGNGRGGAKDKARSSGPGLSLLTSADAEALAERLDKLGELPNLDAPLVGQVARIARAVGDLLTVASALDANGMRYLFKMHLDALTEAEFAFAHASNSQELLLECINARFGAELRWAQCAALGVGLWVRSPHALRQQMEKVARNEFMREHDERDPVACAVLYLALGRQKLWASMWRLSPGHPEQPAMVRFLENDFAEPRWSAAACKNAFVLLGRQRFAYAAAFFLLGGRAGDAANVCLKNLRDPQLALVIARLLEDEAVLQRVADRLLTTGAEQSASVWVRSIAHDLVRRRPLDALAVLLEHGTLDDPRLLALYYHQLEAQAQSHRAGEAGRLHASHGAALRVLLVRCMNVYHRGGMDALALVVYGAFGADLPAGKAKLRWKYALRCLQSITQYLEDLYENYEAIKQSEYFSRRLLVWESVHALAEHSGIAHVTLINCIVMSGKGLEAFRILFENLISMQSEGASAGQIDALLLNACRMLSSAFHPESLRQLPLVYLQRLSRNLMRSILRVFNLKPALVLDVALHGVFSLLVTSVFLAEWDTVQQVLALAPSYFAAVRAGEILDIERAVRKVVFPDSFLTLEEARSEEDLFSFDFALQEKRADEQLQRFLADLFVFTVMRYMLAVFERVFTERTFDLEMKLLLNRLLTLVHTSREAAIASSQADFPCIESTEVFGLLKLSGQKAVWSLMRRDAAFADILDAELGLLFRRVSCKLRAVSASSGQSGAPGAVRKQSASAKTPPESDHLQSLWRWFTPSSSSGNGSRIITL